MNWISLKDKKPKQKEDCIVINERGDVFRAIAHNDWAGGFCQGDGKNGIAVQRVTHWMKFKTPNVK